MKAKAYLDDGRIINFEIDNPPPKRIRFPTDRNSLPPPPEPFKAPAFGQIKCKLAGVQDATAIYVEDKCPSDSTG